MPPAVILYIASAQLLATALLCHLGWTTPMTLSSTQKGRPARPGVLVLAEDIVGVDGGGGQLYRSQLIARYEVSPHFRALCRHLNWFWGAGSLAVAVGLTALVYAVDGENLAFGLGKSRIYTPNRHKPDMYRLVFGMGLGRLRRARHDVLGQARSSVREAELRSRLFKRGGRCLDATMEIIAQL